MVSTAEANTFQQKLLPADDAVLHNLLDEKSYSDEATAQKLKELETVPTVITARDLSELNTENGLSGRLLAAYISRASKIVRNPADVVFLTHLLLYLGTSVPSAILLYTHYTWPHAVLHGLMQLYYQGPFTLMLHNHIHHNGVLAKRHAWADQAWPIVLEPLMGHTWHSYYYHHVKHHHVEGNGPEDLSSTIRYQRDEPTHFAMYLLRFLLCVWIELPLYFLRKRQLGYALRAAVFEVGSYVLMGLLAHWRFLPTLSVFVIPLLTMRLGMMLGNWGQHALVDEVDPTSDFRTSITLIDEASNRHCFNDGYHTSHHLNPRRHWKAHPAAFLAAKSTYASNDALVFMEIDFLMITFSLLRKNYAHLARKLVPMGEEQCAMTMGEREAMLRRKTRRFTEREIADRFYGGRRAPRGGTAEACMVLWRRVRKGLVGVLEGRLSGL